MSPRTLPKGQSRGQGQAERAQERRDAEGKEKRRSPEEFARYRQAKRDAARLDGDLDAIERAEIATLVALGHTATRTDDLHVSVFPTVADSPQGQKARLALGTLLHLRQLRVHVADGNAALAAVEALRVGFYSSSVLFDADSTSRRRRSGGKATAAKKRAVHAAWRHLAAPMLARGASPMTAAIKIHQDLKPGETGKRPAVKTIYAAILKSQ